MKLPCTLKQELNKYCLYFLDNVADHLLSNWETLSIFLETEKFVNIYSYYVRDNKIVQIIKKKSDSNFRRIYFVI